MKFTSILSTAILSIASLEASSSPLERRADDNSRCLIANNPTWGWCEKGVNCPPCWVKQGDNLACYDYVQGTKNCDNWPGMFDRTKVDDMNRCLIANNERWGWCEKGVNCPPCWVKMDGRLACFDYKQGTQQCDNWDGMFDRTKLNQKPEVRFPAETCDMGQSGTLCNVRNADCPPCWFKTGNKYDCYDYLPGKKCHMANMIDTSDFCY